MVTLKPRGMARFVTAAFLLFWLCGWAAGEGFALWLLANGVYALMSGMPLGSASAPLQMGPAIAIGCFLVFWLAMWTLGGVAAMAALFRMLWAEDRLLAEGGGLVLERKLGPFRRRREFARDSLRRILLTPRGALALETSASASTVELSRLGTPGERYEAAKTLRSELGLRDAPPEPAAATLPKGWEEIITPEGERAVVPAGATRKVQARVVTVIAVALCAATVAVVPKAFHRPELFVGAIQLALGAVALAWGAVWLARGRMEWRIGSGRMTLRRRFGSTVRDVFEVRRFELVISRDSDGGDTYNLEAASDEAVPPAPVSPSHAQALVTFTRYPSKNRRRITSATGDPAVPRQLGAYLARVGGIPFEDRATPEVRAVDFEAIKEQLEKSGPLGRFALRFVTNAQKSNRV